MLQASLFALADIRKMIDSLPIGVLLTSPQGQVLHLNKALADLTGFAADEAIGLPCRHILRAGPCVSGCALGCGPAGGHQPVSGAETDLLTFKKRKTPVRLSHFPVFDEAGETIFYMDTVEDLTESQLLRQRLLREREHGRIIGKSAAMERITALIPRLAPSSAPVFISGETGTGKDSLAEALHHASARSREPFVRLSAGPLPQDLLLAEIFGQSEAGRPIRPGRFQQAAGGSLYIAELADIPPLVQARLSSFIDDGSILPPGALRPLQIDVRLIVATSRKPEELGEGIDPGLFHRLNVARIDLPPLRERREDIEFLLQHFLDTFARRFKKDFAGFSPASRALLASYTYPGNVRELRNIVEYAAMVCPDRIIEPDSLPAHLSFGKPARARKKRS